MTTTCAIGFSDVRIRYPNETGALAFSPRNATALTLVSDSIRERGPGT